MNWMLLKELNNFYKKIEIPIEIFLRYVTMGTNKLERVLIEEGGE